MGEGERMKRARLLALVAAAALLAAAPAAARAATAVTETATSGAVKAVFTYTKKSSFEYTGLHLKITRSGATGFDGATPPSCTDPVCGFWPANQGKKLSVSVLDLDGDQEPEVLVQLYSGGAHCCIFGEIYSYAPATGSYLNFEQNFGSYGYKLADLNGDGLPEFSGGDQRFDEAFTAHAASTQPVQIFDFRGGALVDVTRSYPALVRKDAAYQLKLYRKYRARRDFDVRGFLASYVADEYLLGRKRAGLAVLSKAFHRGELNRPRNTGFASGRSYVKRLKRFLAKNGY
jgi:hypothetical protein